MDILYTILMGILIVFAVYILGIVSIAAWGLIQLFLIRLKKNKDDDKIRNYFKEFNSDDSIAVLDETPRYIEIGDGRSKIYYLLKPLKYRQYTRLCVLFAKTLEKLQKANIDLEKADELVGQIIEHCEDDFYRALAYILYYSKIIEYEENEQTELVKEVEGVTNTYKHIKKCATLKQITVVLEVLFMQNDIHRAIKGFGRISLTDKKKVHRT